MSKRKLSDKLINRDDIKEELQLISESKNYYISKSGNIYVDYGNNKMYPLKNFINNNNGYIYCNIKNQDEHMVQRRVHRLVANAYLPNPNNYPVVMHLDNNKSNPSLDNLQWGTSSENTKNAFDDGLVYNSIGFDDSQAVPVCMFDLDQKLIYVFGSCREATRCTGITTSGILYQCNHKVKSKPRCGYYFRYLEEYDNFGFVL